MFPNGCCDWCLKPAATQTWANFKLHFNLQDCDRQETATAVYAGYSGAVLAVQPVVPPIVREAPAPATSIAALAATVLRSGAELVAFLVD
jgi:hypothetical protein